MENAQFWDSLYREGNTGWDLGHVSGPLRAYIDQLTPRDLRILIPGAGSGYEARYLLEKGFTNITVVDIAPTAVQRLRTATAGASGLEVIQADFFTYRGKYDLILEQTFFCANPPERRGDYARHCHELLADGGKIAGVLFNRDFEPGHPPFGGDADLYEKIFSPYFTFKTWQSCYNSDPERAGWEWFMILEKKAVPDAGAGNQPS